MNNKFIFMLIMLAVFNAFHSFNTTEMTHSQKSFDFAVLLSDEDFIVKDNNTFLELGSKYNSLKTNEKILNISYANEKHVYNVINFENFILTTEPIDEGIISHIQLTTYVFKTYRGIGIGDNLSNVFEKYGAIEKNSSQMYMYFYNNKALTFYVDKDDKVVKILFGII